MSLNRKLEALGEAMWRNAGPRGRALRERAFANLCKYSADGKPCKTVERLPDATLIGADGEQIRLHGVLGDRPGVVLFFRGSWCPMSTTSMRAIQQVAADIAAAGFRIVGITPQRHITLDAAIRRNALNWPLLTDPDLSLIDAMGIGTRIIPEMIELYTSQGFDLETLNESKQWVLPLEATFIVDRDKRVRYAEAWPYPTRRTEPADIVARVRAMAEPVSA